jgi:hypothetical protein
VLGQLVDLGAVVLGLGGVDDAVGVEGESEHGGQYAGSHGRLSVPGRSGPTVGALRGSWTILAPRLAIRGGVAGEEVAEGRGVPAAALAGWDLVGVQLPCDLAEGATLPAAGGDPVQHVGGQSGGAAQAQTLAAFDGQGLPVRSAMMRASNAAMAETTLATSSPVGVLVSTPRSRTTSVHPSARLRSSSPAKSATDRARRSRRVTARASARPRASMASA